MPRNFKWTKPRGGARFWLQVGAVALAVLNATALFLCIDPPGGSRKQLLAEQREIQQETAAARVKTLHLKAISDKVQLGGAESSRFETKYFLPKRTSYQDVIAEVQRMGAASGLQEREAAFTEEPIEGASDLSLLNAVAAFQGS